MSKLLAILATLKAILIAASVAFARGDMLPVILIVYHPVDDTGFRDEGDDFHLRSAGTQKRVHLEDFTEQARPGSPPRPAGVDFP